MDPRGGSASKHRGGLPKLRYRALAAAKGGGARTAEPHLAPRWEPVEHQKAEDRLPDQRRDPKRPEELQQPEDCQRDHQKPEDHQKSGGRRKPLERRKALEPERQRREPQARREPLERRKPRVHQTLERRLNPRAKRLRVATWESPREEWYAWGPALVGSGAPRQALRRAEAAPRKRAQQVLARQARQRAPKLGPARARERALPAEV